MKISFDPSEAVASIRCDWEEIEPPNASGARLVRCRKCGLVARTRGSNEDTATVGGCGGRGLKPLPPPGPGTALKEIFEGSGATADVCKGLCEQWRLQMDEWGVEGCYEHRTEIIDRIKSAMYKTWTTNAMEAGWISLSISREPWFKISDPVGCIVDEAIRRAKAIQSQQSSQPETQVGSGP